MSDYQRCTATAARTGERCRRAARSGHLTCDQHAGAGTIPPAESPIRSPDWLANRKHALGMVNAYGEGRAAVLLLAEVLDRLDRLEASK